MDIMVSNMLFRDQYHHVLLNRLYLESLNLKVIRVAFPRRFVRGTNPQHVARREILANSTRPPTLFAARQPARNQAVRRPIDMMSAFAGKLLRRGHRMA